MMFCSQFISLSDLANVLTSHLKLFCLVSNLPSPAAVEKYFLCDAILLLRLIRDDVSGFFLKPDAVIDKIVIIFSRFSPDKKLLGLFKLSVFEVQVWFNGGLVTISNIPTKNW